MREQVQRSEANLTRLNSLPSDDRKGQATSPVADEANANVASIGWAPSWNMELIEQLAEHGSLRKTKCPTGRRSSDTFDQCKPLGMRLLRVLRHVPEEVYLRMDWDGWVQVEQLGDVINHWCNCNTRWQASSLQPLMRELGMADRVQFDRHWCRAAYGHSTQCYQPTTFAEPTEPLFHGTSANNWQMIECFGLLPKGRRFVQLTTDFDYATNVAAKSSAPVVLQVLRAQALAESVHFVATGSHVWLADAIPANLLQVWLPVCSESDLAPEPSCKNLTNGET